MIKVRDAITSMKISRGMLTVMLNDGMRIYIDVDIDVGYIDTLIPQMWGRLHLIQCENDYEVLQQVIEGCYLVVRSNLIGIYSDDFEYMITDIVPLYHSILNKIQYIVLLQNDDLDTWKIIVSSLTLDEINDKIKTNKLEQ